MADKTAKIGKTPKVPKAPKTPKDKPPKKAPGGLSTKIGNSGYMTLERRHKLFGWVFLAPWLIGVVFLFIYPMFTAVRYSFSDIALGPNGFELTNVGWANYTQIFTQEAVFLQRVLSSVVQMIYSVPIIVFLALFVAMILKEKFIGRTFARALFFLPVIIASGVIIGVLSSSILMQPTTAVGADGAGGGGLTNVDAITNILVGFGIPTGIIDTLTDVMANIFDLTWRSGVQILLLLAALHNIPASSYEVASIEGATEWEKFWKVTFPLVSPTMLVAVIYTLVDSFTDYQNPAIMQISFEARRTNYSLSSAMGMFYFLVVMLLIMVMYFIMSRFVYYENE